MINFDLQRFADDVDANDLRAWESYAGDTEATTSEKETVEDPVKEEVKPEPVAEKAEVKDATPAEKHKIKVQGQEIELTLGQLKARAQMAEDYTRKTQAVSEERRAVEAEKARVQAILSEIEASKNTPEAPIPQQVGTETAAQQFKRETGEEYHAWDDAHAERYSEILEARASAKAEANFIRRMEEMTQRTAQQAAQAELQALDRFVQTEPKEVVDFTIQTMFTSASTDPMRFDALYGAYRKLVSNQANLVTPGEAKALHEHAIASRKAFYGNQDKPKEETKEMKTESSESPVRVNKKLSVKEIREMHSSDLEDEFNRYMKGG